MNKSKIVVLAFLIVGIAICFGTFYYLQGQVTTTTTTTTTTTSTTSTILNKTVCTSWTPIYEKMCIEEKWFEKQSDPYTLCYYDYFPISLHDSYKVLSYWKIQETDKPFKINRFDDYGYIDTSEGWCAEVIKLWKRLECFKYADTSRILGYECKED